MSDAVIVAINAANVRLNGRVETLQAIGGQVVGNTNSFSQQAVNSAWRKLQNRLANLRYSGLQQELVYNSVPPVSGTDPLTQVYFGPTYYFDGAATWPAFALPGTIIQPYELTERATGSGALFTEMDQVLWSLPRVPHQNWNRSWLWRNNTLYLPGSLVPTDITLLYAALIADFADGTTPWFQQTIPLINTIDAFADYICREISIGRGDLAGASAFQLSAEANAKLIVDQDSTGAKSVVKASEYQKMGDAYTPVRGGPETQEVKR